MAAFCGKLNAFTLQSAGMYLFSKGIVDQLRILPVEKTSFEENIINDFWSKGERLFAYTEDCPFIDIGVPDDYRRAASVLLAVSQTN